MLRFCGHVAQRGSTVSGRPAAMTASILPTQTWAQLRRQHGVVARPASVLARQLLWSSKTSATAHTGDNGTNTPVTAQQLLKRYMSSTPPPQPPSPDDKTTEQSLTVSQRFNNIWKKYGWVAIGTYAAVYTTTLSTIAVLIHMGVDVKGLAEMIGLGQLIDLGSLDPKAGTLVLAFIATKFTSPIRIPIVILLTPRIARFITSVRTPSY